MKFLLSLFLLSLAASETQAQNFTIDWFTIDGGGGTSTGGVYSISGTIGQPDAAEPMTGGQFALEGGLWSILAAVQLPGAPKLTIRRTTTNTAMVSWDSPATGFALQEKTNLNTANWVATTNSMQDGLDSIWYGSNQSQIGGNVANGGWFFFNGFVPSFSVD